MKKGIVISCVIILVVMPILASGTTEVARGEKTSSSSGITLGGGGLLGVCTQEEMIEIEPAFGFSVHLGVSNFLSGYFDMLFYEASYIGYSIPSGVTLKGRDKLYTGAFTLPLSDNGINTFKLGGGYTIIQEEIIGEYMGQEETLLELQTDGFCILAEIASKGFTGCIKYIIPNESDNSQGLVLISAIINLL